jgi:hypothetical protein
LDRRISHPALRVTHHNALQRQLGKLAQTIVDDQPSVDFRSGTKERHDGLCLWSRAYYAEQPARKRTQEIAKLFERIPLAQEE